ncbi:hypothetical protein L9F63_020298 [Diploptera punctata]|uniref:Uncharacterized protein n=1 Tax=Diploptera punctata TaxID=6984 RepID=A0AAD7ZSX9_DIPPU|nr:hypothetical protein L9F63_020298 [Diploptera punctata]
MNCAAEHEDVPNRELLYTHQPSDVKVEIKSEREEENEYVDIEHETFPAPDEMKLEVTSDAAKNEIKNIDIEEQITEHLVTPFPKIEESEVIDIKREVAITEVLVPI